ncbi:AAA family ATPase [Alkalinema sp. FACHB-956]|uniref:AAA family ATPase n=1 Tax=Alkalinema sp. FACHB-956 TaxID=2692768 RepID=UPI0016835E93|nr:AAA family ATPase [Alkalinema sp. FACHB-956]MBD2329776.1 AAA family ATPase [Alkalinema sp. FACHB-956]
MEIPGYCDLKFRCEGSRCTIYSAYRSDGLPVILKHLRDPYPSPAEVARFRREYQMTRQFQQAGIIHCLDLIDRGNQFVMVLEDFGGQDLDHFLTIEPLLPMAQCLELMLRLAQSLGEVHRALIIHKDINPSNIVWNPQTDTLKLIDFGIASQLSRETPSLTDIRVLEGTLAYISPEQTGRMNRSVDFRSDLYALGVTFYRILTGQLPFPLANPLEMIHAHIARSPMSPQAVRSDIPAIVAQIVLKLMAKNADDRYQSPYGLVQDLQRCYQDWQTQGQVTPFDLGQADFPDRLILPQTLYGREPDLQQLMTAFERCRQGSVELVLVAGYSGIGKTSLVNEIHRPVTAARGEFIKGKYDQFNRSKPYGPLADALTQWVQRLLTRRDRELAQYRETLLDAVGSNGRLLVDVIPEFAQILGTPPPLPEISDTDVETRLTLLFRGLLRAIATADHPIVLFIDDLQWADLAFVRLLQRLVTDPEAGYLLLVGAYRDHEVSAAHPLMLSLEEIRQTGKAFTHLTLTPLSQAHTHQLIQQTLRLSEATAAPLADLCFQRTQGNPFFLNQLLETLYTRELLTLDPAQGCWVWDLQTIQAQGMTDDVISFLIDKMGDLPPTTVQALQQASVVGNHFDLASLTTLLGVAPGFVVSQLQPALHQGLIVRVNDSLELETVYDFEVDRSYNPHYRFLHDRVQQAAYSLLRREERVEAHYHLGLQRLAQAQEQSAAQPDAQLFATVTHLNQAQERLSASDRFTLAQLNLQAGVKAKQAAAFQVALEFLLTGVKLLEADAWQQHYALAHGLYTEAAMVAYLANELATMERLHQQILDQVRQPLDALSVHEGAVGALIAQNQLNAAIDYTLRVLREDWGAQIPSHPTTLQVLGQLLQTQWALRGTTTETLLSLPEMTHAATLAIMQLQRNIVSPTYYARPNLLPLITFSIIRATLTHGIAPESAYAFALMGVIQCSLGNELKGYEMGKLALQIRSRIQDPILRNRTAHVFNSHVRFWKDPYRDAKEGLRETYKQGLDYGDVEFAAFSGMMSCAIAFYQGDPLDRVKQEMNAFSAIISDLGQGTSLYTHEIHRQAVFNLMGDCTDPSRLVGLAYNEEEAVPIHQQASDLSNLSTYWYTKTFLHVILGDYDLAVQAANTNRQYLNGATTTVYVANYFAYDILSQAQVYAQSPVPEQRQLWRRMQQNRRKLARWAAMAPMNLGHQLALVDAELARLQKRFDRAIDCYEQAIALARQNGFLHHEALASELAGRFYLSRNYGKLALAYLRDARYLYQQWGAIAKVQRLDDAYPALRQEDSAIGPTIGTRRISLDTTTGTSNLSLDFESVILASQAISNEIVLEQLLQTLMKTVLATAGAQTGLLFLEQDGTWQVVAADGAEGVEALTLADADFSPAILNYVIKSRESVVLNNATQEGLFTDDPYVVMHHSQSILCAPLLNQGQLNGILYLENNLTTGAFTPERVEVLQILSSQAAISLQNAQLYVTLGQQNRALEQAKNQLADYSRTLEQKVQERTQELSQTLEVLKATQAELRFENELLRSAEAPNTYCYQVGGSLPMDAPTYVVRSADRYLYKALHQGQFCYILNSRQMGKSSLMVRMLRQLQQEGYSCVALDLTLIGSETVTLEQWYKGLVVQLWQGFDLLGRVNLKQWWNDRLDLSPVQRLGQFLEEVLLTEVGTDEIPNSRNLVIFLDEIDSVLGLPFAVNDFFGFIRACYNQRSLNPIWNRLTFTLLGVATPSTLITDIQRTPFNIGQAIVLEGFKEHESQPLLNGLIDQVSNPQTLLKALLFWTNGQPFLTQKLCQVIRNAQEPIPANQEAEWVADLVQARFIDRWESQDEPEHLRTIADRLLHGPLPAPNLLNLYRQILEAGSIGLSDSPETAELLLSGIVNKQQGQFQVSNRIYAAVFNSAWIEAALSAVTLASLG